MKKRTLIFAFALITGLTACKKDRTCNCTTTVNGGSPTQTSFVIKHVTKNQALAKSCVQTKQTYTDSTGAAVVRETTCKLAK